MSNKFSNFPYYIYLHTNGTLQYKTKFVVDSMGEHLYFESDLVVKYWYVQNEQDLDRIKNYVEKYRAQL